MITTVVNDTTDMKPKLYFTTLFSTDLFRNNLNTKYKAVPINRFNTIMVVSMLFSVVSIMPKKLTNVSVTNATKTSSHIK